MKTIKKIKILLCIGMVMFFSLSVFTVRTGALNGITLQSADDKSSTNYTYKTTSNAIMHSPVASSYFYSKVKYLTPSSPIILVKGTLYSDLALSVNTITTYTKSVKFTYKGFDSNFQEFSGSQYHTY